VTGLLSSVSRVAKTLGMAMEFNSRVKRYITSIAVSWSSMNVYAFPLVHFQFTQPRWKRVLLRIVVQTLVSPPSIIVYI
jgi:hypothetical protein